MARKSRILCLLLACLPGCVERTVSITTEPHGATVFLNDEEIGQSPVKVPFTWYGDYEIIVRKPGYKTLQTHQKIKAPWYQTPVIDIFAECLVPFTIHDERTLPVYSLEPETKPDKQALIQNAEDLRQQALTGS
jgi:PEGA domain